MRILIVAEFIAPVNSIASIRWTKFGKYLNKNHNCEIDVLTNKKAFDKKNCFDDWYEYDVSIADDLQYFNHVFQFRESALIRCTNAIRNKLRSSYDRHLEKQTKVSNSPSKEHGNGIQNDKQSDEHDSFLVSLSRKYASVREKSFVKCALKEPVEWTNYDVIISTFSPKWTHLVAEAIKKAHPSIIWLADYRDPLTYKSIGENNSDANFALKHTILADTVLCSSDAIPWEIGIDEKQRWMLLTNGFDGQEIVSRKRTKTDKFYITYTGTLYNDHPACQDLRPLFKALTDLISDGSIEKDDIKVRYCGKSQDIFMNQVTSFDCIPWKSFGNIPREQAMEMQDSSSLLVLCSWNTAHSQGVIAAKVFEYLCCGAPIVYLCSGDVPGSITKEIIDSSNSGVSFEEANYDEDYSKLKEYVLEKYTEWKNNGMTSLEQNKDYIHSFEHSELADTIFEEINKIIDERDERR